MREHCQCLIKNLMSSCCQRLTTTETLSTVKLKRSISFQQTACLHLATIYVFTMRWGMWRSWQYTRSPILWQSLVVAGSSGRHVLPHFTGWPIRLSTRLWWSRWSGAATVTFKLAATVRCVSQLHTIHLAVGWEIIQELLSHFNSIWPSFFFFFDDITIGWWVLSILSMVCCTSWMHRNLQISPL